MKEFLLTESPGPGTYPNKSKALVDKIKKRGALINPPAKHSKTAKMAMFNLKRGKSYNQPIKEVVPVKYNKMTKN